MRRCQLPRRLVSSLHCPLSQCLRWCHLLQSGGASLKLWCCPFQLHGGKESPLSCPAWVGTPSKLEWDTSGAHHSLLGLHRSRECTPWERLHLLSLRPIKYIVLNSDERYNVQFNGELTFSIRSFESSKSPLIAAQLRDVSPLWSLWSISRGSGVVPA